MRYSLRYDPTTKALKLVAQDFYNGIHERYEWTVKGGRGRDDLDGVQVHRLSSGAYEYQRSAWGPQRFEIEDAPVFPERVECPKATNRRRKCALCAS